MKRGTVKGIVGLVTVIALAGTSCSGGKEPGKAALPPEREKMAEEYRKGVEKSATIVAAKVNGVNITMNDLINKMNQIASRHIRDVKQRTPEVDAKVKKEALDALVFRELAVQEAIRRGMKAAPEAVEERLKAGRAGLGTDEAYRTFLERSGFTEASLRKQIEKDVLLDMIAANEISKKVKVDEKRVKDTFNREKNNFVVPETFNVEDVFFPGGKGNDAAMNKAGETLSLIKKNKNDILGLAPDKSFMVGKGTVTQQEYPNIYRAIAAMKAGDLSPVIREGDGLHIVKVLGKEPPRQMSFEEAKGMIVRRLTAPLAEKRKQEWEQELKKNAKVEILLPEAERKLRAEVQGQSQ